MQNETHIKFLASTLDFVNPENFISIVVFSNRCKLNVTSEIISVIHRQEVLPCIEEILSNRQDCISAVDFARAVSILHSSCMQSDEVKQEHIEYVKSIQAKKSPDYSQKS